MGVEITESDLTASLTPRRALILGVARGQMARGIRPTEVSIGQELGVGGTAVRSHLSALRRLGLLPRRACPSVPAPDTPQAVAMLTKRWSRVAAKRLAQAELDELRERFEVAARNYEKLRMSSAVFPDIWNAAHDRLLVGLRAYARARGSSPCLCDGIAYYPNPSGDGFVRNASSPIRKCMH